MPLKQNLFGIYAPGRSCSEVRPELTSLTIIITRDKYVLMPLAWTVDKFNSCFLSIEALDDDEHYVKLGTSFMSAFYTRFDYENNEVFFAVSLLSS